MTKYGAKKCSEHTPPHDSLKECRRFLELVLLQRAGEISALEEKPKYQLIAACRLWGRNRPAVVYIPDFRYWENGHEIVEDVKGMKTQAFILKARLMKSVFDVEVRLS